VITRESIDKVLDTARLEEVIGDFVQLKRSGSNFKGLSPFTKERSPSFMVSPVKQIWKDFSSGKGGNVLSFLMEHEQFTYPEAIRYLAKRYNIEIEETERTDAEKEIAQEKESLFIISEFAAQYFQQQLWQTEPGKAIGLSYFRERAFTPETIQRFGLGYSPEQKDAFAQVAQQQGYQMDRVEKTGLVLSGDYGLVDRFRGRVMFPIQSLSGRVLGFGGRILGNDKKVAKYLNSPESDIYQKSKVLYGIYHARQAIAKKDNCYLVEGYTDVIQFHQSGIENTVASSGTALTVDQIRLIQRLTRNVTVLFDGDAAGLRASLRGIDMILEAGMNVRVCSFPYGEDPDSFARRHTTEDLQAYLDSHTTDFIRFKASLLMGEAQSDPIKKAEAINDMVGSIAKVSDPVQRELYLQACSRIMELSEEVLRNALAQWERKRLQQAEQAHKAERVAPMEVVDSAPQAEQVKVDVLFHLERTLIEILLLYGPMRLPFTDVVLVPDGEGGWKEQEEIREYSVFDRVYLNLQEDEIELANEAFKYLYDALMSAYQQGENLELDQWIQRLPQGYADLVSDILMQHEKEQLHRWEYRQIFVKDKVQMAGQYVTETLVSFREYVINKRINALAEHIKNGQDTDTTESLSMIKDYVQLRSVLTQKVGRFRSHFL